MARDWKIILVFEDERTKREGQVTCMVSLTDTKGKQPIMTLQYSTQKKLKNTDTFKQIITFSCLKLAQFMTTFPTSLRSFQLFCSLRFLPPLCSV